MSGFGATIGEFPTADIVKNAERLQVSLALIEQLKGGSALRFHYDQIRIVVDALLRDIPFVGYPLAGLRLFRGYIDDGNNLPANASRFSYRPLSTGSSWGRCNRAGTTVFYGAPNEDTVISELGPEVGDTLFIAEVKVKDGMTGSTTCIGEIDYIRRYGRPLVGSEQAKAWVDMVMSRMSDEQRVRTWLVDAFFADAFSQNAFKTKDYKVTSALSEELLEARQLDGFAYPSVAHRGGLNLAIKPEAFDEKFEWVKFQALHIVDHIGFGLYARAPIATAEGVGPDGTIQWHRIPVPAPSAPSSAAP